ncbi:MAG: outer membrane protein assembly factor, partial [Gemmatimonadetes bacterium]|nr:outer membrane protein assembly factor [Gemmatimonadota bacterium]
ALVRQRIAAQLRTPLKDRTLYRSEAAARVFWDRDHETLTQVLASRAQYPGREYAEAESDFNALSDFTIEGAFDPGGERLVFGFGSENDDEDLEEAFQPSDDDFWFAHPLAAGADTLYQFRSADTLSLFLPDGRSLRAVKLDVLPRVADVHRMTGSLWIEPESGALVRAAFRLSQQFDAIRDIPDLQEEEAAGSFKYVPGLFKPWTFDMDVMAVDYSLWDFRVWLPRSARFEGVVSAGVLKMPVAWDLSYAIESVVLDDELEHLSDAVPVTQEVHFATRAEAMAFMAELARERGVGAVGDGPAPAWRYDGEDYLVPEDLSLLETSPDLPPPIWDDAAGFTSAQELEALVDDLADLPAPPIQGIPWAANWGFQRPELMRYNRVEGPAIGGRFQARLGTFVGPVTFSATGFFGFSDLEPKARLAFERETLSRRIMLGGYRELRALDERGRPLEFGNSLNALLFGRDDGEYFLATGADLEFAPHSAHRQSWSLRLYAERQDPVAREMNFSLAHAFDGDWRFRPVLRADRLEEAGGELRIAPWWGTDPLAAQFGLELYGQGAATRPIGAEGEDGEYGRARITLRTALPLAEGRWRVGAEAAGGRAWGDVPVQRHWTLGGPVNLRGYDATTTLGRTFARGRLEVGRVYPAWSLSGFADAGWTDDRPDWAVDGVGRWAPDEEAWAWDDVRWSVGVGWSLLDGLVRFDVSRGLTGPDRRTRIDLYLDALF